jgi:glycosyltransferase involved in cell wall biosynthesis
VADQEVDLEHIVQDSVSDDGTQEWLPHDRRVKAFIEKDRGMYDAVNRGLSRASGEIFAYLNCDEQYLPGALASVQEIFETNPTVEMVFADTIVTDAEGKFLCHRKAILPHKCHSMVSDNLSILTCATFFRRSVMEKRKLWFDARLRDTGDAEWLIRCLDQGVPMTLHKRFTSAFTETGLNMNLMPNAQLEKQELFQAAPLWAQKLKWMLIVQHRLRKLVHGAYQQQPFSYSLHTLTGPAQRVNFDVAHPKARWVR